MLIIVQAPRVMPPTMPVSIDSVVSFLAATKDVLAEITGVVLAVTALLVAAGDFLEASRELSEVGRDLLPCLRGQRAQWGLFVRSRQWFQSCPQDMAYEFTVQKHFLMSLTEPDLISIQHLLSILPHT